MKKIKLNNTGNYTLVDDADYDKLVNMGRWHESDTGYAVRRVRNDKGNSITIRMHRVVAQTPPRLVTDHINGNKLDNRRKNLRTVSQQINAWNVERVVPRKYDKGLPKGIAWDNTRRKYIATKIIRKRFDSLEEAVAFQRESELYDYEHRRLKPELPTGVFRNKSNRGYQARIQFNGKRYYLGSFSTIAEAQQAYETKRVELTSKERQAISGSISGGKRAAQTNKEKHGEDFYKRIGASGGRKSRGGGFTGRPDLAQAAGTKGGRARWAKYRAERGEA